MGIIIPARGYWAKNTEGSYVGDWKGSRRCMVPVEIGSREEFMHWHSMLAAKEGTYKRAIMFALVQNSKLEKIEDAARNASPSLVLEAKVEAADGFSLAVFGNAHSNSGWMQEKNEQENSLRAIGKSVVKVSAQEAFARVREGGYTILEYNGGDMINLMRLLNEAFGDKGMLEFSDVLNCIVARNTPEARAYQHFRFFAAADANGRIVSFARATHMHEISMHNGNSIQAFYLADGATFREHQGRGIFTALKMGMARFIASIPGAQKRVIFSDVLAHSQASAKAAFKAGMEFGGCLPAYVNEEGKPHVTVNVFYFPAR